MSHTILLIDDDAIVVKSVVKLLVHAGFAVIAAHSAREALNKIKAAAFDLVIADARMPAINGFEALHLIRTFLSAHGRAPVPEILITGYATKDYIRQARAMNVAGFLYKPFDISELLGMVRQHLTESTGHLPGKSQLEDHPRVLRRLAFTLVNIKRMKT